MYSIPPLVRFTTMLEQLFSQGRIWQRHCGNHPPAIDTGFAALNQCLPGGGWPADGVTEILYPQYGIGELSLLLPCLRQLSEKDQWMIWVAPPWQPNAAALAAAGVDIRCLLLVSSMPEESSPRHSSARNAYRAFTHNSTNQDIPWTLEESLKSGAASAVLGWPQHMAVAQARRLQMCAAQYQVPCFLFKQQSLKSQSFQSQYKCKRQPARQCQDQSLPEQATPCALRLRLSPLSADSIEIDILKQRHGWPPPPFSLTVKRCAPFHYPATSNMAVR